MSKKYIEWARELDSRDKLAGFRDQFVHDDSGMIYLDGNSLGRLPLKTAAVIKETIETQWGHRLIRGWNDEWMDVSQRIGAKISKLIGAKENEVVLTDTTSINLFKLAYAALKAHQSPLKIISDELNFPSDLYILQGLIDLFGNKHRLELARSSDGISIDEQELDRLLDSDTALVTLTHVCFKSSFMYDMKEVTDKAHHHGAKVIWDLSHATGAVPIELNQSNADMAVGCTYKYLNGGPGSIAFLYVREDLQTQLSNPIWGWFADDQPFDFDLQFRPANDIRRFQASSPPILSAKSVEPGVDLLLEAGRDNLREKSVKQTEFFIEMFDEFLQPLGFELGSPRESWMRGSHISLKHPESFRICQTLIKPPDRGVSIIPDFRAPDNIRIGVAPIYNSFKDLAVTALRIKEIVEGRLFEQVSGVKARVT